MSAFTDKHKSDLTLQLDAIVKQIRETQPTLGDAFEKRIREDLQRQAALTLDKLDAIRTSGRYSPDGDRAERRLSAHAFHEHLGTVRAATVTKLETQREEKRAAALRPKPTADAVAELKAQETRALARQLAPLDLQTRIRQDDGTTGLLDALEGAPPGFPIAPRELIAEARIRIAEANHPELGDLATLQKAYEFALGVTEQVVLAASGLSALEAATDPKPAPTDDRKPYLVSTGEAVQS